MPSRINRMTSGMAVAIGLLSINSRAQDLPDTIVGCNVVGCPIEGDTAIANCTVVDTRFSTIGLARIPDLPDDLAGFSWVQGVNVENGEDRPIDEAEDRRFDTRFYLGTPPDTNLNGTGACALFFRQLDGGARFDTSTNYGNVSGTCEDALSGECVSALTRRASNIDYEGLSIEEACSRLEDEFADNLDEACEPVAVGNSWGELAVRPLSGSNSPQPITSEQNSTSNCWPITPKADDLTLVASFEETGDYWVDTIEEMAYDTAPILTVFFPIGDDSLVSEVSSQLTCLKQMDMNDALAENFNPGSEDEDGNTASGSRVYSSLVLMLGIAWLTTALLA